MISHLKIDNDKLAELRRNGRPVAVFQNLDLHADDFGRLYFLEFEHTPPVKYPVPEVEQWAYELVGVVDLATGAIEQ